MNRPITSYPCAFSKHAATELSTPPLIASTTRCAMEPRFNRFNPPPAVKPGEISGSRAGALGSGSLPEHPMAEDQPAASRSGIPAGLFHCLWEREAGAMETRSLTEDTPESLGI